jgi:diguanylate cyclase (GGDEF)-like protein/PAS domain S-box-containing protein
MSKRTVRTGGTSPDDLVTSRPAGADRRPQGDDTLSTASTCAVCGTVPAVPFVVLQRTDGTLVVESVGPQLLTLCGCSPEAVIESPALAWNLIHPDDLERERRLISAAADSVTPYGGEFRLRRSADQPGDVWVNARANPHTLPNGDVRWTGILTDDTDREGLAQRIRENEIRFSNTARNIPGAVFRYGIRADQTEFVDYMSPGCYDLWELPVEEVLRDASPLWAMVHEEDLPGMLASVQESARTLQPWNHRWRVTTPSGKLKWLQGAGQPQHMRDGSTLWDSVILDVTDRVLAEQAHARTEQMYRLLAENTSDLFVIHDDDGVCQYVSPSASRVLGLEPEELVGRNLLAIVHADDTPALERIWRSSPNSAGPTTTVFRIRTSQDSEIYLEGSTLRLPGRADTAQRWLLTSRDVSDRIRMEARLRHDATHDLLTGLPNRTMLEERITLAIARRRRHPDREFAVLFLDLDRFKVINDSLGHVAGDDVLVQVSRDLKAVIRAGDLAARLGGDEFVLLLENLASINEAVQVVERLGERLGSPMEVHGRPIHPKASVGIVMSADHYQSAAAMLRDADIAMYRSKADPSRRYTIFDPQMHRVAMERMHLESDLRKAIQEQSLALHFQPIVDLDTGRAIGAEALVRWHHPERGPIPPINFIGLAEESGLILQLDRWVAQQAIETFAEWRHELGSAAPDYVSINLSARDLREADLPQQLAQMLTQAGVSADCLQLEVTEGMLISRFEEDAEMLQQFMQMGVRIGLDDFGTGYSSLAYLHRLPVQVIKADRSFVSVADTDEVAEKVLNTLHVLSDSLGLELIAEGVESQPQCEMLRRHGYTLAQGFHFARPMPKDEFARHVRRQAGIGDAD